MDSSLVSTATSTTTVVTSSTDPCLSQQAYDGGCLSNRTDGMASYSHNVTTETMTSDCIDDVTVKHVTLLSVSFLLPAILLVIFNLLVVGGNLLVIISVFTCRKLRTITNTYIVSLAFADLLLGLLVLPFTGSRDILGYWPFKTFWCFTWLAMDVLLCTASILNLCVISFDRYLAISRPFKYQTIMSPCRAKCLVGCVWVLSFIVCAPPMTMWNDRDASVVEEFETPTERMIVDNSTMTSHSDSASVSLSADVTTEYEHGNGTDKPGDQQRTCIHEDTKCELYLNRGYIIYSALGSFWLPVWVMAFFYWRIYSIAAHSTESVRRGVLNKRNSGNPGETMTLRIHRGGSGCQRHASVKSNSSYRADSQTDNLLPGSPRRKASLASLHTLKRDNSLRDRNSAMYKQVRSKSTADCTNNGSTNGSGGGRANGKVRVPRLTVTLPKANNNNGTQFNSNTNKTSSASPTGLHVQCTIEEEDETSFNATPTHRNGLHSTNSDGSVFSRLGNRFRAINREKKAAKTVGIIVGCFILCWAPFFTWYLFEAFCERCTPQIVVTIFFWLGYVNSAINPCIYALFSKDFRFAFKKILCCRCERRRQNFRERRKSRFRSFLNSMRIQISSRSSDDAQTGGD